MSTTTAPLRTPAWSLSRAAIGLWVVQGVAGALIAIAAATLFAVLAPPAGPVPVLRWVLPAPAGGYALVAVGVRPWLRYRVHRWEVTADAVYTLTGWLTRTWTLVPISRIQTVDVTRSPLQQILGLATVAVLTASAHGTVHVLHLEDDVAHRVADDLATRAGLVRDEAT